MTGGGWTPEGIVEGLIGLSPEVIAAHQGAATTRERAGELAQSATTAGHDPDYIRNIEDFKSRPHQEIYDHAREMQPGVIAASAEAWKLIGSGMQFATMALGSKVRKSAAAGWEGASADAMLAALDRFVGEMEGMQDVANGVGWRLESAALAAEAVKASVPAPSSGSSSSLPIVPGLENPAVVIGATRSVSDGHQEAVWAMTNHYVPNYQPAGQGVPTFAAPTEPGDSANVPGTPGNSAPSTGSPQNAGDPSSAGTQDQSNQGDQTGGQAAESNAGAGSSNDDSNSNGTSDAQESPSADDASTTAAGTETGTTAGAPTSGSPNSAGGVPGSGSPGSSGSTGSPGGSASGAPGGQGGAGVPVAGRAVAGSPAVPGAGGAGGGSGAGAGGRATPGMGGMPGMAGGAGRRQGDQDGEHKGVPEWMINQRNTDELMGPRTPTTPAVFGIDAGPIPDGEWETVRRDDVAESAGPTAFAADQPAQDDWSAAPAERGEQPR